MPSDEASGTPSKIEFYGGYEVYSESGVDLTLLRENLRRSLEQRLENNRRALALSEALRDAFRGQSAALPLTVRPVMTDALALIRQLAEYQVEFVVIGGQAMRAQGSAYITEDLDICYQRSSQNVARLVAAPAPLHPYMRGAPPGLPFRFDAPTILDGLNFTLITDLGDIDCLGEVSGIGPYDKALAQSDSKPTHGLAIRYLTIDGLIAAKRAAGRGKDKQHFLELEELKKLRDTGPNL
jgi:hypothetical protein